jgi:hypothetical protein
MTNSPDRGTRDWDFAGIFKIHAEHDYPFLQTEWQSWKAGASKPDVRIENGEVSKDCALLDTDLAFCDGSYQIWCQNATYEVGADRIICQGSVNESYLEHEVVIPVMNRMVAKKGNYLAYASAVSLNGTILFFPGISGSGKTSVVLELLIRGASFMGDNNVFIDRQGTCTSYSPMIGFPQRNAALFPELVPRLFSDGKERKRQEKRLSFHKLGLSMDDHNFVTRNVRGQFISRFFFHQDAPFNKIFPRGEMRESGRVQHVFFLERGTTGPKATEAKVEDLAALATTIDWIYGTSAGCSHNTLAELAGLEFCSTADYHSVFSDFFARTHCHRVRIAPQATRDEIRRTVDEIEKIIV